MTKLVPVIYTALFTLGQSSIDFWNWHGAQHCQEVGIFMMTHPPLPSLDKSTLISLQVAVLASQLVLPRWWCWQNADSGFVHFVNKVLIVNSFTFQSKFWQWIRSLCLSKFWQWIRSPCQQSSKVAACSGPWISARASICCSLKAMLQLLLTGIIVAPIYCSPKATM